MDERATSNCLLALLQVRRGWREWREGERLQFESGMHCSETLPRFVIQSSNELWCLGQIKIPRGWERSVEFSKDVPGPESEACKEQMISETTKGRLLEAGGNSRSAALRANGLLVRPTEG